MKRPLSSSRPAHAVSTWHTVLRVGACLCVFVGYTAGMSPLSFNPVAILAMAMVVSLLGAYELGSRDVAGKWVMAWMIGAAAIGDLGYGLWWLMRPKPVTGPLTPANDPSPPMTCRDKPGPGDLVMAFGTNRVIAKGKGPFTPFAMGECSGPVLTRVPGGLMVNGIFYDLTSAIAMTVKDNVFDPYQPVAIRAFRPDAHTLVLLDHFDTEVLYVRFLNPTAVRIRGRWLCGDDPRAVISDQRVMMGGIRILGDYFGQQAAPGNRCARMKPGDSGLPVGG